MMGMPITVEIDDASRPEIFEKVFFYFQSVDEKFSTYKETSEINKINRGEITLENCSEEMKTVLKLSAETKKQTNGFFDILKPLRHKIVFTKGY